ncbi:MAG: hypothetical protein ACKO1O_11220 [Erythrobacter sp.]
MRGVPLERIRLALTLAFWQPVLIILGAFAFDLRGAPVLVLIAASLVIAISSAIASWIVSLLALCPSCGSRYFSIIPLLFHTGRSCAQCGLKESESVPPRNREA